MKSLAASNAADASDANSAAITAAAFTSQAPFLSLLSIFHFFPVSVKKGGKLKLEESWKAFESNF